MKALITGITGQDGSYLAELLLSKNIEVYGVVRKSSRPNYSRIKHLLDEQKIKILTGDVSRYNDMFDVINEVKPDLLFNMAAQTDVGFSFKNPLLTAEHTAMSALYVFEAVSKINKDIKIYQSSSSEIFGNVEPPQGFSSFRRPVSPYGASKLFAYNMVGIYRRKGLRITNGILFNHESPRRGVEFVTKKITSTLVRMILDDKVILELGDVDTHRDWGFAPEFVERIFTTTMFNMQNFILGTGQTHSVNEFLEKVIGYLNKKYEIKKSNIHVGVEKFKRLRDVDFLKANSDVTLKYGIDSIVAIMCDHDLRQNGLEPIGYGDKIMEKIPWTKNEVNE